MAWRYLPTCCSLRLKSGAALVVRQPLPLKVTPEEPLHGGYAGVRVGEAQTSGPAAHEKDRAEERSARRTRINEAGDAVPGSQGSITREGQNLQLTDTAATQTTRTDPAPQMHNSRRMTQPRSRQQRDYLRRAQCGSDPEVYTRNTDHELMMHMVEKHGCQQLIQESVAQIRQLDCAACVHCDKSRSRRCNRCSHCKKDTPTRDITVGDVFQDRRQPGHQDAAVSAPNPHQTSSESAACAARSPPPPPPPLMTVHFRTALSGTSFLQNPTGSCSPILSDGHPALHCLPPRHSMGREP